MQLTSSQRWAIGAVALAVLIACSPEAPEDPSQPTPQPPSLAPEMASATPAATRSSDHVQPPGFAGEWALTSQECGDAAKTFKLSRETIELTPGERSCAVESISEEHPTGRSMIYTVLADCLTEGEKSQDRFTLNFGASDTVMQMQLNEREPVRLTRCP